MTGVAPCLEEPSAGAEAGDGGLDLLHDDGSGRCERRLLGAHQIAAQGGPVANLGIDSRLGPGCGITGANRGIVDVLQLLRELVDDLSLALRSAG